MLLLDNKPSDVFLLKLQPDSPHVADHRCSGPRKSICKDRRLIELFLSGLMDNKPEFLEFIKSHILYFP